MTPSAAQPSAADLRAALQRHFGLDAFRGRQEEAIRAVLGGRDALVVMPTGEGKSLVYQLPAMLQDGVTLVVSPLIALMEDQVAALRARGLPAACVHSLLERGEREHRLAAALFAAPIDGDAAMRADGDAALRADGDAALRADALGQLP